MRKIFVHVGQRVCRLIDFFYPPFRKYLTIQFFRYGVTGVANIIFDWVLYFIVYHFILHQKMLDLGFISFKSHIGAKFITFPITFLSGFLLQKYVTFSTSELRGRVQLFRYFQVLLANLLLNYIGLKILVEYIHIFPTFTNMIVTVVTTIFSYFSQKKYTFKKSNPHPQIH